MGNCFQKNQTMVLSNHKINKHNQDLQKIEAFQNKVEELKDTSSINDAEKKIILNEALDLLNITKEPIEKYFEMGEAIGKGKFGVVKEAFTKQNIKVGHNSNFLHFFIFYLLMLSYEINELLVREINIKLP